jgi:hypothetical protein
LYRTATAAATASAGSPIETRGCRIRGTDVRQPRVPISLVWRQWSVVASAYLGYGAHQGADPGGAASVLMRRWRRSVAMHREAEGRGDRVSPGGPSDGGPCGVVAITLNFPAARMYEH